MGIVAILLLLSIVPGASAQSSLPDGPGQKLVELVCSKCHTTERIARKRMTKAEWREEVTEMLQEEDDVTEAEKDEIIEYLAKNFPAKADVSNAESNGCGLYVSRPESPRSIAFPVAAARKCHSRRLRR